MADGAADAVTLEIEQIGVEALSAVAALAPLRPGVEPIRMIQDKILQKNGGWPSTGIPVGAISDGVVLETELAGCGVGARCGRVFCEDCTRRV